MPAPPTRLSAADLERLIPIVAVGLRDRPSSATSAAAAAAPPSRPTSAGGGNPQLAGGASEMPEREALRTLGDTFRASVARLAELRAAREQQLCTVPYVEIGERAKRRKQRALAHAAAASSPTVVVSSATATAGAAAQRPATAHPKLGRGASATTREQPLAPAATRADPEFLMPDAASVFPTEVLPVFGRGYAAPAEASLPPQQQPGRSYAVPRRPQTAPSAAKTQEPATGVALRPPSGRRPLSSSRQQQQQSTAFARAAAVAAALRAQDDDAGVADDDDGGDDAALEGLAAAGGAAAAAAADPDEERPRFSARRPLSAANANRRHSPSATAAADGVDPKSTTGAALTSIVREPRPAANAVSFFDSFRYVHIGDFLAAEKRATFAQRSREAVRAAAAAALSVANADVPTLPSPADFVAEQRAAAAERRRQQLLRDPDSLMAREALAEQQAAASKRLTRPLTATMTARRVHRAFAARPTSAVTAGPVKGAAAVPPAWHRWD